MKKHIITAVMLGLLTTSSWGREKKIRIIGMDKEGKEQVVSIPKKVYSKRLAKLTKKYHLAVNKAFMQELPTNERWKFFRFELGASLFLSVGIGDVLKFSAEPTFRFSFVKGAK